MTAANFGMEDYYTQSLPPELLDSDPGSDPQPEEPQPEEVPPEVPPVEQPDTEEVPVTPEEQPADGLQATPLPELADLKRRLGVSATSTSNDDQLSWCLEVADAWVV